MRALVLALFAFALACGGEKSDRGLDAMLSVHGATFYRGDLPQAGGGPDVTSAALAISHVAAGRQESPFHGALAPGATAAAIAMVGDVGYWIVTAGAPDPAAPKDPTFDAPLSFSSTVPIG